MAGDGSNELVNFIIKTTKEMSFEHGSDLHLAVEGAQQPYQPCSMAK